MEPLSIITELAASSALITGGGVGSNKSKGGIILLPNPNIESIHNSIVNFI